MKLTASALRQIIAEETRRVLREGRYDALASAFVSVGVDSDEDMSDTPEGLQFIETFKNAVAPIVDDDEAVGEEIDAALAAFKAAGVKRRDLDTIRDSLQLIARMVAADLEASGEDAAYEIERDRVEAEIAAKEAAFNAIVARLGSDREFMGRLIPLLNKKLAAKKSTERSTASKAVTAAVSAAMTDEDRKVTDPIKLHNEIQRRLLAHMERKRSRG